MNALYYFLDSSAVVKHYVAEKGSTWVDALVHPDAGNMIAIAQITVAEAAAALGSKLRAKAISSSEFELAVKNMLRDTFEAFNVVELNQPIIQRAVDAIRRHPLRGYDAVQLACALALNDVLAAFTPPASLPTPPASPPPLLLLRLCQCRWQPTTCSPQKGRPSRWRR